jgi:hypothetical protein
MHDSERRDTPVGTMKIGASFESEQGREEFEGRSVVQGRAWKPIGSVDAASCDLVGWTV